MYVCMYVYIFGKQIHMDKPCQILPIINTCILIHSFRYLCKSKTRFYKLQLPKLIS